MLVLEARVHYVNSYCHICSKGCVENKAVMFNTYCHRCSKGRFGNNGPLYSTDVTYLAKAVLEITVHYIQQMSHI